VTLYLQRQLQEELQGVHESVMTQDIRPDQMTALLLPQQGQDLLSTAMKNVLRSSSRFP
jgi:hypothetical protein